MTPGKIAETAIAAVERKLGGFALAGGYCLAFVFEAFARAYNVNRWNLYSKILDATASDPDQSRWANDAEKAMHRLKWVVTQLDLDPRFLADRKKLLAFLQPGDMLFSSKQFDEGTKSRRTAPDREGHIGIYAGVYKGVPSVAENTRANRGVFFGRVSALRLTALSDWDTVTTAARVPKGWKP